jgi:HSP20 family molecular chaperone IbpA
MATTQLEPTTAHQAPATPEERAVDTRAEERFLRPPVDIFEKEDGLYVLADLPGVDKEGVDIHVENGVLTITARTSWRETEGTLYREFSVPGFFRQFRLTELVAVDKISAELRNGVLRLFLPKAEQARPRRVQVKTV